MLSYCEWVIYLKATHYARPPPPPVSHQFWTPFRLKGCRYALTGLLGRYDNCIPRGRDKKKHRLNSVSTTRVKTIDSFCKQTRIQTKNKFKLSTDTKVKLKLNWVFLSRPRNRLRSSLTTYFQILKMKLNLIINQIEWWISVNFFHKIVLNIEEYLLQEIPPSHM
jgi:hypothetical protein